MALRVKLVRGLSGHPEDHRATVRGLGLTKVGRERVLPDTKDIRGMEYLTVKDGKIIHVVSVFDLSPMIKAGASAQG